MIFDALYTESINNFSLLPRKIKEQIIQHFCAVLLNEISSGYDLEKYNLRTKEILLQDNLFPTILQYNDAFDITLKI